jgi:WD40 repeat protein
LASASNDGTVVVWDLKNSKAIFNFKDPDLLTYDFNPQNGIDEYS